MVAIRQDFLRLLREDAEFKAEVRREVLTDEVLNLPEMFARMTVRQDRTSEHLAQIATRQDLLTEQLVLLTVRVDKLTVRVDDLAEQLARLTVRVDKLAEQVADLTEQLARLTVRVDKLTEQVADLTVRVDNLTVRMNNLIERVDRLVAWLENLDARAKRSEDDIATLKGGMIELKMANWAVSFISDKLELRAARIVRGGQPSDASIVFADLIYDAYTEGAIDVRERDRIIVTDLIISAVSRKSKARAYVAVEASYVIDVRDVTRARNSADILAKAFPDAETYSAVYGVNVNPEGRAEAGRLGVSIYIAQIDKSARRS